MGPPGRRHHRDPRGHSLRARVPRHVHRNPTRLHQREGCHRRRPDLARHHRGPTRAVRAMASSSKTHAPCDKTRRGKRGCWARYTSPIPRCPASARWCIPRISGRQPNCDASSMNVAYSCGVPLGDWLMRSQRDRTHRCSGRSQTERNRNDYAVRRTARPICRSMQATIFRIYPSNFKLWQRINNQAIQTSCNAKHDSPTTDIWSTVGGAVPQSRFPQCLPSYFMDDVYPP